MNLRYYIVKLDFNDLQLQFMADLKNKNHKVIVVGQFINKKSKKEFCGSI